MVGARNRRLRARLASFARPDTLRSGPWSATALVLVVALLLGSVLIPARFTSRILSLTRKTHDVIEPARRAESQLELDLDGESTALQEYVLTGDSTALARYRADSVDTDRSLVELQRLALGIDSRAVDQVTTVRREVGEWRTRNRPFFDRRLSRAEVTAILGRQQLSRETIFTAVTRLESYLADQAAAGGERIATFEEHSLATNASLVFVALAAMLAVAALVQRERHLSAVLERRTEDEATLREAAEAFAEALTNEDVTEAVARSAVSVMRARAAFVEGLASNSAGEPMVVVRASAGVGSPRPGLTAPRGGSLLDLVLKHGEPMLVPHLAHAECSWFGTGSVLAACSAVLLPLVDSKGPFGALCVLSGQDAVFVEDDLAKARTLAHLIALAYEKVRLLNEALEGRRALERVMKSRSRLMRGFSHDIKNPLGAADGYAELLAAGIYGTLSAEQQESVERLRNSIQSALALIADLHEFARAETGNVALYLEPVALRDLVRATSEEFRAAAARRGLSLSAELPDEALVVDTDSLRVRQIVSNLVSNAIKYTANGVVVLRLRRCALEAETWATIDVEDTGRGIAADQLGLLFEEFVRLGVPDQSGAGLGLAISQRLAQALGGRITVQSEVGRGSRFTLWLPMSHAQSSSETRIVQQAPVAQSAGLTHGTTR